MFRVALVEDAGMRGRLADYVECRFGGSHSPAGPAELTYLAWVCCSYYVTMIAIFLYPRTHLTLLRYLYTEILFRVIR
jgi:hypothetical protein